MPVKKKLLPTACLHCKAKFQPTRSWQAFCSVACRQDAQRTARQAEYACEYCGLVADTIDHVPPRTIRPKLIEMGLTFRYPFVEVRACRECNCAALGGKALWTVAQRKAFLYGWISRRYRKFLDIPEWEPYQLEALAPELRKFTEHGLAVQALTKKRLEYLRD